MGKNSHSKILFNLFPHKDGSQTRCAAGTGNSILLDIEFVPMNRRAYNAASNFFFFSL
jgi:hypothetical protein